MHVMAPEGMSTCRSKNAKGEWVEKVFDYVIECSSLKGRISDMTVTEDFESRPHKAVTFVVGRGKEKQQMPKAHQEEARKRKVGKKEKKAKKANKGRRKTRSAKK